MAITLSGVTEAEVVMPRNARRIDRRPRPAPNAARPEFDDHSSKTAASTDTESAACTFNGYLRYRSDSDIHNLLEGLDQLEIC